jgi:hypothetical protein
LTTTESRDICDVISGENLSHKSDASQKIQGWGNAQAALTPRPIRTPVYPLSPKSSAERLRAYGRRFGGN